MKFVADLHIHSRFARACSKELTLENIDAWCRIKGVNIIACADFTHPKWFSELKRKLMPSLHDGLYIVKSDEPPTFPPPIALPKEPTLFMIATEVACIYSDRARSADYKSEPETPIIRTSGPDKRKVRRVHHCIFAPNLEVAEKINQAFLSRGAKLASDGRPILGISSQDLLKLLLEVDERCVLIPAHIWTPWFAIFGSFSGYDTVSECFGDLTKHIFALETGLSSDPLMNWRKSELDNYALVSSSDAHSLPNIGREANVFEGEEKDLSYDSLMAAIKNASPNNLSVIAIRQSAEKQSQGIATLRLRSELAMTGTIEFIPDEGRYHYDGHRVCQVRLHPHETKKLGGICPECKKKVTVGVLSRVEDLADLPHERKPKNAPKFWSLIEFDKLIAEAEGVKTRKSKSVERQYWEFIGQAGNELNILIEFPREKLAEFMPSIVVEAIMRMRAGRVQIEPGYDGEYGKIKIFSDNERKKLGQAKLF